jgi:thiamine-phosphate pyrophosphorylase
MLALTRSAVALANERNPRAKVIVNDRLDVAIAAGAAGVHLGRASLPAHEVVRCRQALRSVGKSSQEFLIGVSCHSLEEAGAAEQAGADYIFFGPVFDTPAKRAFGPPQGVALLSGVSRAIKIPTIAIGGVDETNGLECLRAGAAGIAAIRLFQQARNLAELKDAVAHLHSTRT